MRVAAGVIVTATTTVVIVGGILMRVLDHTEYSSIWLGMWWAIQTVTTVGYGDVVPGSTAGKVIAGFMMLGGLSLFAVSGHATGRRTIAPTPHSREHFCIGDNS